jgi:hypothetical protein
MRPWILFPQSLIFAAKNFLLHGQGSDDGVLDRSGMDTRRHHLRPDRAARFGRRWSYWNVVKNQRVTGGQVIQRQALYLGEINDNQREVWRKSIQVFEDGRSAPQTVLRTGREPTRR